MYIRKYIFTILIMSVLVLNVNAKVIFEDHFPGNTIDPNKWMIYGNGPSPNGDTAISPGNVIVNNGLHLRIDRFNGNPANNYGKQYVGAGLENSGYHDITQGRWEIRARFPSGSGLVGYVGLFTYQWPPEIDFAETAGYHPNIVEFTQHWGTDNSVQLSVYNGDFTQFHTYIVDVENNQLSWYVDGNLVATQTQHFSNVPWFIAAGSWAGKCDGNWPGCPTNTALPAYVDIDYVKIYDSIPTPTPTPTATPTPTPTPTATPTPTPTATPTPTPTPTSASASQAVIVTSPNGGEIWKRGTNDYINWTTRGNIGTYVKIKLLKNGVVHINISDVPNTGSYNWRVASAPGTDYKIMISSMVNPSISGVSNSNFTII